MKSFKHLILIALLAACTPKSEDKFHAFSPQQKNREEGPLTQDAAEARSRIIDQVNYDLELDLTSSAEVYTGRMQMEFIILRTDQDLHIDFKDGIVDKLSWNGQEILFKYNKSYLLIPAKYLQLGHQKLAIEFKQTYGQEGMGLVRFTDPVDKQKYTYTNFEPYYANRAYPCVDQPDIKGTYALQVRAPNTWEVISATRETQIEVLDKNNKIWKFPRSEKISSYVFSVVAGPFAKWEDTEFHIPLRLFARQSLAQYVNPQDWFPITRHGLDFFESFFGTAYPYKKYDHIALPDFVSGAMENVAAPTYMDDAIVRGIPNREQRNSLSMVILHEMAHMWFGNLVTMKWWDNLWLNEAFATYMSFVALATHPDYTDTWTYFFQYKLSVYQEDQFSTHHPVVVPVKDTDQAEANFDAFSSLKGAMVLKQLSFMMGEEKFKAALKRYFSLFANQNATQNDFFKAMESATGSDWTSWGKLWLETSGLNAVTPDFQCLDGKIHHFQLLQSSVTSDSPLRSQTLQIAFLAKTTSQVNVDKILNVQISGARTSVPQAEGLVCPYIVYANAGENAYLKIKLDKRSQENLKYSVMQVSDELLRFQLLYSMGVQVQDGDLKFTDFAKIIPEVLTKESSAFIIRYMADMSATIFSYFALSPAAVQVEKIKISNDLDSAVWERYLKTSPGSIDQAIWLDTLMRVTSGSKGLENLKSLLFNSANINQDQRWSILKLLSSFDVPGSVALIEEESQMDSSSRGLQFKARAQAARPDWNEKMKWILEFKNPKSQYSFALLSRVAPSLFPIHQVQLRNKYAEQFFEDLKLINDTAENTMFSIFTLLAPNECDLSVAGMTEKFLDENPGLRATFQQSLQVNIEEATRCRKVLSLVQ